jgi:acetyl-CoA carboxylase alpha subunit
VHTIWSHAVKVELNNKSKDKKHANSWKLNNSLLNEEWIIDEIKEEIKNFLQVNENDYVATLGNIVRNQLKKIFLDEHRSKISQ